MNAASTAEPEGPLGWSPVAENFSRALEATGSGIVIADATVRGFPLVYGNEAFTALTGYEQSEFLGRSCSFLQGPDTDPAAVGEISAALAAGVESRVVLVNYRRDGLAFHNELRISPVHDEAGRVVQIIGVQNDVSHLVAAQRVLEAERDRARAELQEFRSVLAPTALPARDALELASRFLPAEQGVAGDFHLVLPGAGGTSVLAVGDSMGHGLAATRRAMFVRTSLAIGAHYTDDPAHLLEMANTALVERAGVSSDFVTALVAVHDPGAGTLRWASAGHPPPLDLDTGGSVGVAQGGVFGAALGIRQTLSCETATHPLPAGRGVLISTDGLAEARSVDRTRPRPRLGEARVREVLQGSAGGAAETVSDALVDAAREHAGGELSDDLCLVAARVR